MELTKLQQDLLRFAEMRGEGGLHVGGLAEQKAVEDLAARELVRADENKSEVGYDSRIYVTEVAA